MDEYKMDANKVSMKDSVHYAIEAVLAVAVIVLFVLMLSLRKSSSGANTVVASGEQGNTTMPVAYIDIDSLMSNYTYSIDLNEQIIKKFENSRANLTERARKLQAEVADFQRKMETGSFLTRERAENEQKRLIKRQEDLQNLEAQLSQELAEEQQKMNQDLRNTIMKHLAEFNKGNSYQIVFGKMNDNILYAGEAYNITKEVVDYLNNQYGSTPSILVPEEKK